MNIDIDYRNLITVEQLIEEARAFSEGTVRRWLYRRRQNGLVFAVIYMKNRLMIDFVRFNIWLSRDKEGISEFQNLRTKEQIVASSRLTASKLEYWLKNRHWNGLDEAVITKSQRRLYIDIIKFNQWLLDQNQNEDFGRYQEDE